MSEVTEHRVHASRKRCPFSCQQGVLKTVNWLRSAGGRQGRH